MANPQSLNKYSYVFNNPIKYVDPTGEVVELVTRALDYKPIEISILGNKISVKNPLTFGNHSFVRITPENPSDFGGDMQVTLGGGNNKGALTKGYNHPNDFDPITSIRGTRVINPPEGMTSIEFEKAIFDTFKSYSNDVKYDARSRDDIGRNSNDLATHFITDSGGNLDAVSKLGTFGIDLGLKGGLDKAPKVNDQSETSDKKKNNKTKTSPSK